MEWILANKEWLLSGVGVVIVVALFKGIKWLLQDRVVPTGIPWQVNNINHISVSNPDVGSSRKASPQPAASREEIKASTRIVFIDDDAKFKVVKILKNSGWTQTSLIKDISSLDDPVVIGANIIFVDIQGVGSGLGFRDEGLGLAGALKDRYPAKKIVIYSAEPKGEMFHHALKKADDSLDKNADPYQFERMIEGFVGLHGRD